MCEVRIEPFLHFSVAICCAFFFIAFSLTFIFMLTSNIFNKYKHVGFKIKGEILVEVEQIYLGVGGKI